LSYYKNEIWQKKKGKGKNGTSSKPQSRGEGAYIQHGGDLPRPTVTIVVLPVFFGQGKLDAAQFDEKVERLQRSVKPKQTQHQSVTT